MGKNTQKPKLIFFQWRHEGIPAFLQLHMQLHVRCLSEFFDVILVNKDCDYQQICDIYQPDLTLFESGYRTSISQRINISNTSSHPDIPKLGLHNGDPWCECRSGFISDMEHWGIETFFTIGTVTAEHTPEIAENLFVWPNFIDPEIYCDYGLPKIVPILFNGYMNSLYPWRQKIYKILSSNYPSLIFPHLGYESRSPAMIFGEQYARTINASWFVPACGTLAREVVRKHFEIPASKSCLITEETPALVAAGFVDMQNCVFADEDNVSEKVSYLFHHTGELQKIINGGYDLVHSHHTLKHRDQIFQWFNLNKSLRQNQRIVQIGPFGPLKAVEDSSGITNTHISCNGLNLKLLKEGDRKLQEGKFKEAELLYLECLDYIHWMAEPKLKVAICNLFLGNVEKAYNWILDPIQNNLSSYKAFEPDPVEWAYLIITLLCKGNLNEALIRVNQFPSISHAELNRSRCIANYLKDNGKNPPLIFNEAAKPKYSIHQLPSLSFVRWVSNVCVMLQICKQDKYAAILANMLSEQPLGEPGMQLTSRFYYNRVLIRSKWLKTLSNLFVFFHVPDPRPGLPPISEIDFIIRLGRWAKMDSVKRYILKNSHALRHFFLSGSKHSNEVFKFSSDYIKKKL